MSIFDGNRDGVLDYQKQIRSPEIGCIDHTPEDVLRRAEFASIENPTKFNAYDTNHDGLLETSVCFSDERRTEHLYAF